MDGVNTTGYNKLFAGSDGINSIEDYAVYSENSGSGEHYSGTQMTRPVGVKLANELGLFDMSGNVWEWNWDLFGLYPNGTLIEYLGFSPGSSRVFRGGSWNSNAPLCDIDYRLKSLPYGQWVDTGLRLVRN